MCGDPSNGHEAVAEVTRNQFLPLVAIVLVWMAFAAGWVVIAAIAAALLVWGVLRLVDGDIHLDQLATRLRPDADAPERRRARVS